MSVLARGLALFVGVFITANLVRGFVRPALDHNSWLLDLRPLPLPVVDACLAITAAAVLTAAFGRATGTRGTLVRVVAFVAAAVAMSNAARVLWLGHVGALAPFPIPFSVFVAAGFAWIGVRAGGAARRAPVRVVGTAGAFAVVFALGQMACFGATDYRRTAHAIVVPGARVYASGAPSRALADRVRTACELYHEGRAPLFVVSGGPGDGEYHETDVMRRIALESGVPADAIRVDRGGVNSRATCENVAAILAPERSRRVLVVSHAYHLPRLDMGFEAVGLTALTVPLTNSHTLLKLPYFVAREAAAFWAYYLRPPAAP